MEVTLAWLFTWMLGILPVLIGLIWWWNELWYAAPIRARLSRIGKKLPPGHMGLPFLGELPAFLWYFKIVLHPDNFINSKRKKYGDGVGMYRTYLFGQPCIIACSPASSKFVLQADEAFCLQRWPTNDLVGEHSLISAVGLKHKRIWSFVSAAINQPSALRRIALVTQPRIVALLRSWVERGTVVAYDEVKKMTFENIGRLLVSFEPGPLLDKLDYYFQGLLKGFRANPVNCPGTAYHYALQIVRIFREELKKRKRNQGNEMEARNDLMDGLMKIKDENGDLLTEEEVVDNIASLVVGGYESTAIALVWAIYYLAKHPDVRLRLREENMAISRQKKGEYITSDDISQLKYTTKNVVEEILRLANIAPFVFRRSERDVEFQGQIIPKGWRVICWLRFLHTDPQSFEDPLCFNPDRWNEPINPRAFQVFGGGARICSGNMLARMQLTVFLHHLVVGYEWKLVNPNANVTYLPNPKPVDGLQIAVRKI